MLDNMGRPDAVWSPKGDSEGGGIDQPRAQRLRAAFRQAPSGMAGRGGLLVSEVPGVIQPLQWSPQDVVEIERAKAIKTDICNVFGVPDAKLERNAANLAAAKTADYAHCKDAGIPRCSRNEETLNARLIPMFDNSGRLFVAYDFAGARRRSLRPGANPHGGIDAPSRETKSRLDRLPIRCRGASSRWCRTWWKWNSQTGKPGRDDAEWEPKESELEYEAESKEERGDCRGAFFSTDCRDVCAGFPRRTLREASASTSRRRWRRKRPM